MNTEIFQKSGTTDYRNMQQQIFMQHSFLFVNILVPYRLVEHNDVLTHFIIIFSSFLRARNNADCHCKTRSLLVFFTQNRENDGFLEVEIAD